MKNITLGSLSIPITQYASQGNAVLGIRDSGKSFSGTYLAEQLYAAGVPFVAFDPSGVWKFLRVPGKGAGLPVVVAGGMQPDLPLTPQSAPEIVRAAMKSNVSLVIDLYSMDLSKADWSRIVESCVRVLLYENGKHGLRHIFIEEAAEFVPQMISSDKARVYAEVEKLARIGGNALLGYTLINQRAEQVNKAVLELCDCLLLHRQKGKNSIKSLEKWLELSTGGDVKEIVRSLPTLPSGQCWVWPAHADQATLVKMPAKNTYHPDRRALIANPAAANVKRVDATEFVSELKGSLEKFVHEAEANDPKKLKQRIAELERELIKPRELAVDVESLKAAEERGFNDGYKEGIRFSRETFENCEATFTASFLSACRVDKQNDQVAKFRNLPIASLPDKSGINTQYLPNKNGITMAKESRTYATPRNGATADASIGDSGKRRILVALAQQTRPIDQRRLSLLTGLSARSGTWSTYLSNLRSSGYIDGRNEIAITPTGLAALGPYEPLPTGDALIEYWRSRLGASGKRAIFDAVVAAYPKAIDQEEVAGAVNLSSRSGTWSTYLSELRGLGLIDGRKELRASEDLF